MNGHIYKMEQGDAVKNQTAASDRIHHSMEGNNITSDSTDDHFDDITQETALRLTGLMPDDSVEGIVKSSLKEYEQDCWYSETKDFICSVCGNSFANEKQFYGHLRIHTGEIYWKCNQCSEPDVVFESQSKLRIHENLCHNVVRPYKCRQCGLKFNRASQLDYHLRSVHLGEKSQVCQICGKGFFRRTDLQTHLNIHLGTNLCICEICGRKFNHVSNLIRHGRTHAGVKPYPCTICGKRFTQISSLARHKRIHDRTKDSTKYCSYDNQDEEEEKSKEQLSSTYKIQFAGSLETNRRKVMKRRHYCKICGESFQFVVLLRQHEKRHTESMEVLECRSCGQKFQKAQEIKEHNCRRMKFNGLKVREKGRITLKRTSEDDDCSKNSGRSSHRKITGVHLVDNQICIDGENCIINDDEAIQALQTKETIVYVTSEQLANMNVKQTEDADQNLFHEHMMELVGKINAAGAGSDRDTSINISEILGSYCSDNIGFGSVDNFKNKLSEVQIVASPKNVEVEGNKIYVHSTEKNSLPIMSEDGNTTENITFDLVAEKNEDSRNLDKSVELSQLEMIRDVESSDLVTSEAFTAETIENKLPNADSGGQNQLLENNLTMEVSKDDASSSSLFDSSGTILNSEEPTLRLVQAETGEQFYELVMNNLPEKLSASQGVRTFDNECKSPKSYSTVDDLDVESDIKSVRNKRKSFELIRSDSLTDDTQELQDFTAANGELHSVQYNPQETLDGFVDSTGSKSENGNHNRTDSLIRSDSEEFFYANYKNEANSLDTLAKEIQQSVQNSSLEFIKGDSQPNFSNYERTNFDVFEKTSFDNNTKELFDLAQDSESNKEISTCEQLDGQAPMVRLVQNDEGEQFFELIRDPSELGDSHDAESMEIDKLGFKRIDETHRDADPGNKKSELLICVDNSMSLEATTGIDAELKRNDGSDSSTIDFYIDFAPNSGKSARKIQPMVRKRKTLEKKFQCSVCNKSFSTRYNFKQHVGIHFTDQQKFQCKECGVLFAWKSTLNKHMANHHRADGPQKFVCEICPKVYSTLSQVNEHVKRDHLKERNHVCPHCGKSFFKKFDLKTHSRTHTKERPYMCRACGKGFHHQSHIIRHERIHSGEKPYSCDVCQKTFTQLGSMKVHKQRHREIRIDMFDGRTISFSMDEDDPLAVAAI